MKCDMDHAACEAATGRTMTVQPLPWDLSALPPERAQALADENVEPLLERFQNALTLALATENLVRYGWETAGESPYRERAVVQFQTDDAFFGYLMNGRLGYRARYLVGPIDGDALNTQLVKCAVEALCEGTGAISATSLDADFVGQGSIDVDRETFLRSLVPQLSKVWFARLVIGIDGNVVRMPIALEEPRIQVGKGEGWKVINADRGTGWLDIKGAFLNPEGPYQPKSPVKRSIGLHETGLA
jgi:hypothetical protein